MENENIPLEETDCFSTLFLDYIKGAPALQPLYERAPDLAHFKEQIHARKFPKDKRETLASVLRSQYATLEASPIVSEQITALTQENTYTVTTGHQLNIFTGPLYFIYKIITTINACKSLKDAYPDCHFVPVYWMASEDHDFEEISYFRFEGKTLKWQTDQKGAVGRFDPSALQKIAATLPGGASFFKEAYQQSTLANAVRSYVNHLFGAQGLIVLDADDARLKRSFIPVIKDDLLHHHPAKEVHKTSNKLASLGYPTQVTAREINLFYLHEDTRGRIERAADGYRVVDSEIKFSEEAIQQHIADHPERFSPNVILRPLYQELILPNLAYIGGPSEIAYWLQLKSTFDHYKVPFPILMPRNFGLVWMQRHAAQWHDLGLATRDLFKSTEIIFSEWVRQHSIDELSYESEQKQLERLKKKTEQKARQVDPTLSQHIEALYAAFYQKLQKAEKKLLRAEKRKHQEQKTKIRQIKEVLFPEGTLQERKENFLNFYLKDPAFVQRLLEAFDPFNFEMYLLRV